MVTRRRQFDGTRHIDSEAEKLTGMKIVEFRCEVSSTIIGGYTYRQLRGVGKGWPEFVTNDLFGQWGLVAYLLAYIMHKYTVGSEKLKLFVSEVMKLRWNACHVKFRITVVESTCVDCGVDSWISRCCRFSDSSCCLSTIWLWSILCWVYSALLYATWMPNA